MRPVKIFFSVIMMESRKEFFIKEKIFFDYYQDRLARELERTLTFWWGVQNYDTEDKH